MPPLERRRITLSVDVQPRYFNPLLAKDTLMAIPTLGGSAEAEYAQAIQLAQKYPDAKGYQWPSFEDVTATPEE